MSVDVRSALERSTPGAPRWATSRVHLCVRGSYPHAGDVIEHAACLTVGDHDLVINQGPGALGYGAHASAQVTCDGRALIQALAAARSSRLDGVDIHVGWDGGRYLALTAAELTVIFAGEHLSALQGAAAAALADAA
jgi:hypothetical protein